MIDGYHRSCESLASNRILKSMPFLFYYNPYLVTTLKNYNPVEYYEKLADILAYLTSDKVLKQRLNSTSIRKVKFTHRVRTMGAKSRANGFKEMAEKLRTDHKLRAFHEGKSKELPTFYHQRFEQLLGKYARLLSISERYPDLGQPEPNIL